VRNGRNGLKLISVNTVGSSGQVVERLERRSLETSASESREKEGRMCVLAGRMCVSVCGLVNWPLMVVVCFFCLFLMKNVAKSSTVTVGLMKEEEEDLKDNNHATLLPIYNFIYMYFSGSCIQNPLDSNMWWA